MCNVYRAKNLFSHSVRVVVNGPAQDEKCVTRYSNELRRDYFLPHYCFLLVLNPKMVHQRTRILVLHTAHGFLLL